MSEVRIETVPKQIIIYYEGVQVELPRAFAQNVEQYWKGLIDQGRRYTRGDVLTVDSISRQRNSLRVYVKRTDYAHLRYAAEHDVPPGLACRVIFPAALVETSDDYFVFGDMASHTAHAGRLQCVAGGIELSDLRGGHIDLHHRICEELNEEIGIDANDGGQVLGMQPSYLKTGGLTDSIVIIYVVKLAMTHEQVVEHFDAFCNRLRQQGITPEFSSLVCIPKQPALIMTFLESDQRRRADYLSLLLTTAVIEQPNPTELR